ncbi:hypothetical protein PF010_g28154 [Phytophthora fragariae]|uniref:Uncharacterized protein n=1 Tax=Phytophthora fragariae TaxID=53985 RepID=A0A6G0JSC7_9STRA|nr:hypothetical protein PF010_g28154 [Phytophthora fragariae]
MYSLCLHRRTRCNSVRFLERRLVIRFQKRIFIEVFRHKTSWSENTAERGALQPPSKAVPLHSHQNSP